MGQRSRGSSQPGLVDTIPKVKAVPKQRAAGSTPSNQSEVGKVFKTTKPGAGSKSGISKDAFNNAAKETLRAATEKRLPPKTICSVDFGTTYSGVAVVGSVNCGIGQIQVIHDWPDGARRNEHLEKVPSRIAYPEDNPGLEEITFGYEVTPAMKSYTWIKLLLVGDMAEETFNDAQPGGKARHGMLELPRGKTAQVVITDILRCLYKHTMDSLGEVTPGHMLTGRAFDFWLTTPACWDNEANQIMLECAKKAGFGAQAKDTAFIMSEPEAALLANLSTSIDRDEGIYKPGMNVCVCDIGGGTTDTQTLKILALNPLEAKEPCVGSGAKIGMTDIEFRLHDYCEAVFGDAFRDLPTEVVGPSSEFAEEFEVIKRSFDGQDLKKSHRLRLLPLKKKLESANSCPVNYDFVEGKIILKGTELREFFEPLIEAAFGQVDTQIAQLKKQGLEPLSMIVLAGGGGKSKYVINRFKEHCQEKLPGSIIVRRDERGWSAVVRGGAVRGLESGTVVSRESKRAFGLVCHQKFEESVDDEEDSFQCPIFGKRARDRMDWILHQGDTTVPGMKVKKQVYISPIDMRELLQYWDLFECEDENAPRRLDDAAVTRIARIKVDLKDSSIARKRQKISSKAGKQEAISIRLELTVGSVIGVLQVHAYHGRTKVGRAEIEYAREKGKMPRGVRSRY